MRSTHPLRLFAILTALAAVLAVVPAHAASDLGKVDFPTSGSSAAQEHFLRGTSEEDDTGLGRELQRRGGILYRMTVQRSV